jgi:hypothetical protein
MEFNMEHKKYNEMLYLYSISELNSEEKALVKSHLSDCQLCREELKFYYNLNETVAETDKSVPDEFLLKARNELRGRLRIERKKENFIDIIIRNISWYFRNNYKFVLNSAAGIAAGLILGFFLFYKSGTPYIPSASSGTDVITAGYQLPEEPQLIRNIKLNDADPFDDYIEFTFDAVKQVNISGSINDEKIRSLLLYAILNGNNPGLRLNSLNLLNASEELEYDNEVKEAVISSARYDNNPGVRREALKVLKTIPFDQDVKRSFIHIILNDSSSAMRIDALNHLIEAQNDGTRLTKEEKEIFRTNLMTDENSYIRSRARTVFEEKSL